MVRRGHLRLQYRELRRLAGARSAVRQLWPPSGAAARLLRPRPEFFRDGSRHGAVDAHRRAAVQRCDAVQSGGRQRVRRRHYRTRGPRKALRHARRDVRTGLHHRTGDRRSARRDRSASSLLRRRRSCAAQSAVRLLRPARVVACRAPARRQLEGGQPDRLAARTGKPERRRTAGCGDRLQRPRAVRPVHVLGAVHHLQVRLGPARKRLVAGGGRRHVGDRARLPARAAGQAPGRAAADADRAGLVDARVCNVGSGHGRLDDVRGDLRERPRRHGHGIHSEHHLIRGRRAQPGPDTRRGKLAQQLDGRRCPRHRRAAAAAWSRTCRWATGASARRSISARRCRPRHCCSPSGISAADSAGWPLHRRRDAANGITSRRELRRGSPVETAGRNPDPL